MNHFTSELIAKAKAAASAEELFALAKANNVELTVEEAKIYFEQLSANGAVSDDDLNDVAGGGSCPGDEEEAEEEEESFVSFLCLRCQATGKIKSSQTTCPRCKSELSHNGGRKKLMIG